MNRTSMDLQKPGRCSWYSNRDSAIGSWHCHCACDFSIALLPRLYFIVANAGRCSSLRTSQENLMQMMLGREGCRCTAKVAPMGPPLDGCACSLLPLLHTFCRLPEKKLEQDSAAPAADAQCSQVPATLSFGGDGAKAG